MSAERIYLDYNATSPLRPEARAAMLDAMDAIGNPSSVHAEGRAARAIMETARQRVAALVGARAEDVIFTSGATEAAQTVVGATTRANAKGHARAASSTNGDLVLVSAIEHPAVAVAAAGSGRGVEIIPVTGAGEVSEGAVPELLARHPRAGLIAVMLANNETGVVQPVRKIADCLDSYADEHDARPLFFVDAVQAAGRIPINFPELGCDFLALSSHKIGGPAGVGALVVHASARERLTPLIVGGGQERGRRAGTENIVGIAGFGAAASAVLVELTATPPDTETVRLEALREALESGLKAVTPEAVVIGAGARRLPNTTCVALPGAKAETMIIAFDLAGFAVSAGAACSSGKVGRSEVLAAMGLAEKITECTLRISLGWNNSKKDIEKFLVAWRDIAPGIKAGRQAA